MPTLLEFFKVVFRFLSVQLYRIKFKFHSRLLHACLHDKRIFIHHRVRMDVQILTLYWCKIQKIDGLVALISFFYLLVEFSWVGCTTAATCKLKCLELLRSCSVWLAFWQQLPSFIWRMLSNFTITLYAHANTTRPLLPSAYDFWMIGNIFLTASYPRVSLRREFVLVWALACYSSQVLRWFHTISKRN